MLPWFAAMAGWQWTFLLLVPGPIAGAAAMWRLMKEQGTPGTR